LKPHYQRWLCALFAGIAASAFAYQGAESHYAFAVPRAQILTGIQTIGVMPLSIADEVPNPEAVSARYDAEIVKRLQSAGFSVVPPAAMREIQEKTKATLGGVYDPMSGQPIKEKVDAFNEFSTTEYLATHKVDAILRPVIRVRMARFGGNVAQWDGATDGSSGRSGFGNFMMGMTGVSVAGTVPALSLVVRLSDAGGKALYTGAGGLQVLGYARTDIHSLLLSVKQIDVDPKSVMTDPARDARALSLALDPLLLGTEPHPADIPGPPVTSPGAQGAAAPSREQLLARYPRLTLAPLELSDIPQRDAVRLRYRDVLTGQLTRLGFQVVGAEEYARLWEAERTVAGGYYDPLTGRPDEAKAGAARARVLQGLQATSGPSAVVVARVVGRMAPYSAGAAEWDGVRQSVEESGRFASLFDPERSMGGRVAAISLELRILDPAGVVLFEGAGGIQLTEHEESGRRAVLPASRLFADPAADLRAVDVALGPLAPAPAAARR
jgi:hypothetical protein